MSTYTAPHIFNVAAIKERIERNKEQKDLYAKVNTILKGGTPKGTEDLKKEITEIMERDTAAMVQNMIVKPAAVAT